MSANNFESVRLKLKLKEKFREERRGTVLEREKADDFHRKRYVRKKDERNKLLLPCVEARIKSKSTNERSKKHKKNKEKKKFNSEMECQSEEEQWVEKVVIDTTKTQLEEDIKYNSQSQSERDEWMTLPGLIPCVSKEDLKLRSGRVSKKDELKERERFMLDTLGQSNRELNPYWKDGGTGLPENRHGGTQRSSTTVGDCGTEWLRRALQRAKEQAAEEGRSLEEVAAQRWGSLDKLELMLTKAESTYDRTKRMWHKEKLKPDMHRREYGEDDKKKYQKQMEWKKKKQFESKERVALQKDNRSLPYVSSYENVTSRCKGSSGSGCEFQKPEATDSKIILWQGSSEKKWKKRYLFSSGNSIQDKRTSIISEESSKTHLSSSSTDSENKEEKEKPQNNNELTDKEMNEIGAKLVKAEILGDEVLAAQLRSCLEQARDNRNKANEKIRPGVKKEKKIEMEEETVILARTDARGFVRPLQEPSLPEPSAGRRKNEKIDTHTSGKRIRYFADDDKYSLQDMFEREKLNTVEDENEAFFKLAGKGIRYTDNEDMDDLFVEQARMKESNGKLQARERERAIREHKRVDKALDTCHWCFDSKVMLKHLLIAVGTKAYLCLPPHQSLVEGHCLIVPMYHTPCATQLDEDIWAEMQTFRKALTTMFLKREMDVVFFESAMHLRSFPHLVLECIPMPKVTGDLAPIYFKKAILECEFEWTTNNKLIDLSQKDVRHAIPKNLPYFAVDFGLQGGFAHVIEDEKLFPKNFAQEIIGGMLDLDHSLWRKQRRENFDAQCKKVMHFAESWKPYDFTHRTEDSD